MRIYIKKKIVIIVSVVLVTVAVGVLGALAWLSGNYQRMAQQKLPEWVEQASQGQYTARAGNLSVSIAGRSVIVENLSLIPKDTTRFPGGNLYRLHVPKLEVRGIKVWNLLGKKKSFDCADIKIYAPDISIAAREPDTSIPKPLRNQTQALDKISIATIHILHPAVHYQPANGNGMTIKDGDIVVRNWSFNPADSFQWPRDPANVCLLNGISWNTNDGLYHIKADTLLLAERQLSFSGFAVSPTVAKDKFYATVGHQRDMYHVTFRKIAFQNIDQQLLHTGTLYADTLLLDKGSVVVYCSRIPPPSPNSKMGNFPHQLLLKLPIEILIPFTVVRNGYARYTELNEQTAKEGTIEFEQISGYFSNVTNVDSAIRKDAHCKLVLNGKFMKKASIDAYFDLLLSDTTGIFSINGKLKNVDETLISKQASALSRAEITSVNVHELGLKVNGNQNSATGDITMSYENLKVQLQKLDKDKQLKDRPVLSFLVNSVIVYPDNPMKGKDIRTGRGSVSRDRYKSFFNLIWKTILDGISDIVLRHRELLPKKSGK